MGVVNLVSLSGLSADIQAFLKALNDHAISFDDLNEQIKTNTENLIHISEEIDGTVTGETSIYTVLSGEKIVITKVLLMSSAITTLTTEPTLSLGKNVSVNDFLGSINLAGLLSTTSKYYKKSASDGSGDILQSGDIFKVKITTAATATTFTFQVLIFGFYL